jgi:hypothetical protein
LFVLIAGCGKDVFARLYLLVPGENISGRKQ